MGRDVPQKKKLDRVYYEPKLKQKRFFSVFIFSSVTARQTLVTENKTDERLQQKSTK